MLECHVSHTSVECRRDRHHLATTSVEDDKEEEGTYEEDSPEKEQCLEANGADEEIVCREDEKQTNHAEE